MGAKKKNNFLDELARKRLLLRLLVIKRFVYLGAGGDSGFQVRGMIEVFWGGLKFSIPGFFGGRKIWQVFFGGSLICCRDFLGYSNQSEDSWWCPRILAAKFANKVPPNKVQRIKLTAKTVDEDPASCKRWISRKEIKSGKI